MGSMKDLLGDTPYPDGPGFKSQGTSRDAARSVTSRSGLLRERVMTIIALSNDRGCTADEVAETLNETVLSVRPRVSELNKANRIEKTGARRANISGLKADVWRTKR